MIKVYTSMIGFWWEIINCSNIEEMCKNNSIYRDTEIGLYVTFYKLAEQFRKKLTEQQIFSLWQLFSTTNKNIS